MKFERFRVLSSAFLVRAACYVGLAALALMAWGILVPTTVPVLMSMSAGQVLGGLALACYVGAVLLEVRKHEEAEQALGARRGSRRDTD